MGRPSTRQSIHLHEYGPYGPSLRGFVKSLPHSRKQPGFDPKKEAERQEAVKKRTERVRQLAREWKSFLTALEG